MISASRLHLITFLYEKLFPELFLSLDRSKFRMHWCVKSERFPRQLRLYAKTAQWVNYETMSRHWELLSFGYLAVLHTLSLHMFYLSARSFSFIAAVTWLFVPAGRASRRRRGVFSRILSHCRCSRNLLRARTCTHQSEEQTPSYLYTACSTVMS